MGTFLEKYYRYIAPLLMIGIVVLSFLLGREEGRSFGRNAVVLSCDASVLEGLAMTQEKQQSDSENELIDTENAVLGATTTGEALGAFLGSKNGTKYYRPDCPSAKRIKPENYIWFSDEQDAQLQGYTPASC